MSPHPPKRPAAPKAISPQADTSPLPVGDQRPSHEMIQKNHRLSKRSARLITAVHHNIPASKSEDLHRFSNSRVCRPFFHPVAFHKARPARSEEHTSELQSLMRISYAVFCLKKKNKLNSQLLHS